MESKKLLLLQTRLKVNQQVAATDEVHARERRVAYEILPCEHNHFAQLFADPIAAFPLCKEPPQPLRRHIGGDALHVKPLSGFFQERVIEVGGKHLELAQVGSFLRLFHERHRDGIRLLSGGTTENPNADRVVTALLQELGEAVALEKFKYFRVAEKTRHADEAVTIEGVEFFGVAPNKTGFVFQRVLLVQPHAASDAPLDGGGFIGRKIHPGMVAQQQEDFFIAIVLAAWVAR